MSASATPAHQPEEKPKASSSPDASPLPTLTLFDGVTNVLLLSSVGFLLGVLFLVLVAEYGVLYTRGSPTEEAYIAAEQAYLTLWTSGLEVKAMLHVMILVPILTLSMKLSRYTEAAIYFDGVSLGMMMGVLGLYTGSTIPNVRKLAHAPSTPTLVRLVAANPQPLDGVGLLHRFLILLSHPAHALLTPQKALENQRLQTAELLANPIPRQELLKITAAGHSIAIFLLVGIILLQLGKLYAEIEDAKLKAQFRLQQSQLSKLKKDQ
ncbi:ER membrane protein SH3 [Puccinia sorghi]|uniref:ER membrane protein SH3 n=1 Tax=Puccinia sorghi TaxID=27349 RepID=A0A0L6USR2_9BASI|nr:ER membrane protein SH3 [Puccinia sorghi]